MTRQRPSSGQMTLEYVVLVACFIAALLTMQIYLKRAMAGRLRSSADSVGEPYDAKRTFSKFTQTVNNDTTTRSWLQKDQEIYVQGTKQKADVTVTMTTINKDESERKGEERVGTLSDVELFEQ